MTRKKTNQGPATTPPEDAPREEAPREEHQNQAPVAQPQPTDPGCPEESFYTKHYSADEKQGLTGALVRNLDGEIGLTRVAARRVLGLLSGSENVRESAALVNAMTMAAMRVALLLKAEKYLAVGGDDRSIQEVLKQLEGETRMESGGAGGDWAEG